jgi:hypothetical protein
MQVFLPFADFTTSVQCLDNKRLGKQRVECYQIMRAILFEDSKGWRNHPATKMFKTSIGALQVYTQLCCGEWISRGFTDTVSEKISDLYYAETSGYGTEYFNSVHKAFVQDHKFHQSHRLALLMKDFTFYKDKFQMFPQEIEFAQRFYYDTKDIYIWPTEPEVNYTELTERRGEKFVAELKKLRGL